MMVKRGLVTAGGGGRLDLAYEHHRVGTVFTIAIINDLKARQQHRRGLGLCRPGLRGGRSLPWAYPPHGEPGAPRAAPLPGNDWQFLIDY